MNQQLSTLRLDGAAGSEVFIPTIMRWIIDAEQPFAGWLYRSEEIVRLITEERIKRPTSEIWLGRMSLTQLNGDPFGGFVGLTATSLQCCFAADVMALLSREPKERRVTRAIELREALSSWPPVAENTYYLSHLGISPEFRGRGLGRYVIDSFLQQGRAEGFKRFQLNVLAENEPAVRVYGSVGFVVEHEFLVGEGRFRYFCMVSEC
jgi:ribosomal protein S18 acetylase RimI-like enzyme